MNRNLLILAGLTALALGTTGCDKLKARDNLNKGIQSYKNARYPEAVAFFQKAVELDPSYKTTHLYLATASLSALGYEHDTSEPVVRLWNDNHHVGE